MQFNSYVITLLLLLIPIILMHDVIRVGTDFIYGITFMIYILHFLDLSASPWYHLGPWNLSALLRLKYDAFHCSFAYSHANATSNLSFELH